MSKLEQTMEFLGLSYKKEMQKLLIINLVLLAVGVGLYFLKIDLYIILIYAVIIIVVDFVYFSHYSTLKNKLINERDDEFISLMSYFQIFISNHNNVYNSFRLLLPYTSSWMKEQIETLLREIDNDKTVQPFINLGLKFKALIIESVLISIYQMVEQGEEINATSEFSILFSQLSQSHQIERIQAKEHSFDITSSFPLVGAAMLTVLIMFCVISIIGEVINVI